MYSRRNISARISKYHQQIIGRSPSKTTMLGEKAEKKNPNIQSLEQNHFGLEKGKDTPTQDPTGGGSVPENNRLRIENEHLRHVIKSMHYHKGKGKDHEEEKEEDPSPKYSRDLPPGHKSSGGGPREEPAPEEPAPEEPAPEEPAPEKYPEKKELMSDLKKKKVRFHKEKNKSNKMKRATKRKKIIKDTPPQYRHLPRRLTTLHEGRSSKSSKLIHTYADFRRFSKYETDKIMFRR